MFNTAQDAQEAKPPQTVADIYANRATRQPDGSIQVGRATTIKKPYTGTVPVQEQHTEVVVPISDESLSAAQSRIAEAKANKGEKAFKSALSAIYKKVFQPMKNVPVDSMTYEGQPYTVDVNKGVYRKVISDKTISAERLSVLDSLPEIIQNAQYVGSGEYGKAGRDDSPAIRYDYFETAVNIGGKDYAVLFDVEVLPSANNYRTHRIVEIEITPIAGEVAGNKNVTPQRPSDQLFRTGLSSEAYADTITSAEESVNPDGRDMGSVSPEDSTGAAPAGFDPVSQWQMEADAYHPVNEAAAQTTMEERGRAPMDIPTTDRNGRQVSKLVSTLVNANITTNEAASALAEDARNGVFSAIPYTDDAAHFGDRRQACFITESKARQPVQLRLCGSPFVWPKLNLNIHDPGFHLKGIFAARGRGQLIAAQSDQLRPQPQTQHLRRVLPRGAARVTPPVIVQTGARADAVILADEEVFVFLRCVRFESVFLALMRIVFPQPFGGFHPKLQLDASVAGKTGQGIELPNGGRAAVSRQEGVHSGMARGSVPLLPTVVRQHIFEYVFCLTELVVQTVGGVKIVGDDSYGFGSCHVLSP